MTEALSTESRRLSSGQHTFNVRLAGSGPPLLLLHGFTGSSANWLSVLPRLAAEHRVLAVDLIGHGDSAAPPATAAYAMDAAVHDLATLLDALRVPRVDIAGYSMGARLALAFAVDQPARVRCLVLESGSPGLADAAERAARRASDERLAAMLERDGVESFINFWERQPLFASQAALPPARREELRCQRLRNSISGLAGSLRGMGTGSQAPLWDRLPEVHMSTLVLAGELDLKYTAIGRAMAAALPSATLTIAPGAGHSIHFEQPDHYTELLTQFLQKGSGNTPSNASGGTSHGH